MKLRVLDTTAGNYIEMSGDNLRDYCEAVPHVYRVTQTGFSGPMPTAKLHEYQLKGTILMCGSLIIPHAMYDAVRRHK